MMNKQFWRGRTGKALLLFAALLVVIIVSVIGLRPGSHEHALHVQPAESEQQQLWTCSMHPQIRQAEAGQCPICGMDLVPVAGHGQHGAMESVDRVRLSDRAIALSGLVTEPVRRYSGETSMLRLLGIFEPDETRLRTVTAWIAGRIDSLHVNVTGQRVSEGQEIATLYSPEIFAAHQDLLVARRQFEQMRKGGAGQTALSALEAARERLFLLGVPNDQLARMELQSRPLRAVAIHTPFAGTVIERMAIEGEYVATGAPLYRIGDLDNLWLQLDAYERDLSRLELGQSVQVVVEAVPDSVFSGEVTFIEPILDLQRRTVKVRVEIANNDRRLRPGMFAEAVISVPYSGAEKPLVIPATAALFTGRRALVYVEVSDGGNLAYEPRIVRLGSRLGDVYPVLAGLAEGEQVVTRGAFAIDADLQIRGGASMMSIGDDRTEKEMVILSSKQRQELVPVLGSYLDVQQALAGDDLAGARQAAEALSVAVLGVSLQLSPDQWSELAMELHRQASHIGMADQLDKARQSFEILSKSMILLLGRFGNPLEQALGLAFCPMAFGGEGALWVQHDGAIKNAYFGEAMLRCGEIRQQVPSGAFLRMPAVADELRPAPGHRH